MKKMKIKNNNKYLFYLFLIITSCVGSYKYDSSKRYIYSNSNTPIISIVVCTENREKCNFYTPKESSPINRIHVDSIDYYFRSSDNDFKLMRGYIYVFALRSSKNFDKGSNVLEIKY